MKTWLWCVLILVTLIVPFSAYYGDNPSLSNRQLGAGLFRQALLDDKQATHELTRQALEADRFYWISLCAQLNLGQCMSWMGDNAASLTEQKRWWLKAAEAGQVSSQVSLAKILHDPQEKNQWLQRAAQSGAPRAIVAYYRFLSEYQPEQATTWLWSAAQHDPKLAIQQAQLSWNNGNIDDALALLTLAQKQGSELASEWIEGVQPFVRKWPAKSVSTQQSLTCQMQLQFVADSLNAAVKAGTIMNKMEHDERISGLPICVSQPVFIAANQLACSQNKNKRLVCNVLPLVKLQEQQAFSHAVVISSSGKANVNNGIMFLDLEDDYNVYVHELAHFAGFVDEYPLSEAMAKLHCFAEQAPNLVFSDTPLKAANKWQAVMSTDIPIELGKARTCDRTHSVAYKPVSQTTFMEYHEIETIPELYLNIWQQQLDDAKQLTPVYVNFAQYFEQQGDPVSARHWWQQFELFKD